MRIGWTDASSANVPRREVLHEPEDTTCSCGYALKRIGQDVAEKLDYTPGVFTVEPHGRGKWVCARCETLVRAPVAPHIIDKGLPTPGLLAQVLVAKYLDHLPLYRQEHIFERAGLGLSRSTLGPWVGECGAQLQPLVDALTAELLKHDVLHADETPVAMLNPGHGKTHRAYLWSYCTTRYNSTSPTAALGSMPATSSGCRAATNRGWRVRLVCDDHSGYKQLLTMGVTEAGCLAHARRKFFDLCANHKSQLAEEALEYFVQLYEVEREVQNLDPDERRRIRQIKARPVADALGKWLTLQRQKVPTARLFAGKRAAAVMSPVHSARLKGQDPYAYLKDVLERLPTQPGRRIGELLRIAGSQRSLQADGTHRRRDGSPSATSRFSSTTCGSPRYSPESDRENSTASASVSLG